MLKKIFLGGEIYKQKNFTGEQQQIHYLVSPQPLAEEESGACSV
jgi:hypothetical protein